MELDLYKGEIGKLETSLVKLYNCKIDSELKEGKNEEYNCITKAYIGEEKLESIFYLSLDKEQYKYVSGLDYKNTLFNMKGVIQVRKNKKDIKRRKDYKINKKVNYLQPNLLNRPLSNYSLNRFFNFATEKTSNTKRFNELNYKELSEQKR